MSNELFWEESIHLISAATEAEAAAKAERLGRAERVVSFETSDGMATWTFDRIERICAIQSDALEDGTEVYSRFLRDSEVKSLLTPFPDE